MATTNLNIRTDKAIKDQAEEIFNELGLNMTTAVNMFLNLGIRKAPTISDRCFLNCYSVF